MQFPQLHVGIGRQFGPFTIFPVWSDNRGSLGLSTGAHAQFEVTELASGPEVNRLTVRNTGSKPALLLEGELLEGGHQHRVAARSVLLGPGEQTDVPAFCVEQGRWGGATTQHSRRARRAPLLVRAELAGLGGPAWPAEGGAARAVRSADQQRVWQRVDRFSSNVSPTGSLVEAFDLAPRLELEVPAPLDGQRGVVVGLMGRVLTLELFGTATLFARHWEQFAESLRFEAGHLSHVGGRTAGQTARDFAASLNVGVHLRQFMSVSHDHGRDLTSFPVRGAGGHIACHGLAVSRGSAPIQPAHLSVWNATHPFASL